MRITNQTVGKLIIAILIISPFIIALNYNWPNSDEYMGNLTLLLGTWIGVAIIAVVIMFFVFISNLLNGDIKFTFIIPTPFSVVKKYYKAKKEKEEKKARLYEQLFHAKNTEEIDLINIKLDLLK